MNTTIFGKRKQGKSTLALALGSEAHPITIIFDPNNQFPVVRSIDISNLEDYVSEARFQMQDREGPPKVFFVRVGPFNTEEIQDRFSQFTEVLWNEHGITIIVDEAHLLQGKNYIDPNLDRLNRRSASDVLVIQTTHRIVDADPNSRYHIDDAYFFYAYLPRELKTVRDEYGEDVGAALPDLERHHLIHWWRPQGGKPEWEVWDKPEEWYIDLKNNNQ